MRAPIVYYTLAGVGLAAVSYVAFYRIRRRSQQNLPKNPQWELIGTVKEISIYPLQSGAALLLNSAECSKFGLRSRGITNRFLLLLNDIDKKAFAGTYPSMLSISSEIENDSVLIVRAPNKDKLRLDLNQLNQGKNIKIKKFHGFKMPLIECEPQQHEWFSQAILNQPEGLRLYISQEPTGFEYNVWGEDKSEFHPLMVVNEKSVIDLNSRLGDDTKVNHLQFRGNILINCNENIKACDEDSWTWLKIGDTEENSCILQYRAPCLRCILPNINIETCERNSQFEPLKTLRKYRLVHDKKEPTMGVYFNVYKEGVLKVNDAVYALRNGH